MMALDECCPGDADHSYAQKSLRLTKNWLERYAARFDATEPLYGYEQTFFPIIQGCVYPDLRIEAAEHALEYARIGIAIGGLTDHVYFNTQMGLCFWLMGGLTMLCAKLNNYEI